MKVFHVLRGTDRLKLAKVLEGHIKGKSTVDQRANAERPKETVHGYGRRLPLDHGEKSVHKESLWV